MKMLLVLILLAILVLGVVFVSLGNYLAQRKNKMTAAERKELDSLRDLKDTLDDLAYSHREIDPALSVQIIDEIRKHDRTSRNDQKELS